MFSPIFPPTFPTLIKSPLQLRVLQFWTHHSIVPIEGTFGHLAPECFMHSIVDEKTDVFAFGVFLLELLSSKKLAKPILSRGEIEKVVDPRLGGFYDVKQLNRLAFAASLCIRGSSI
ncbi:unnamed protein product [Coffea canephora]|uniref:Serine-threonine/tyrosine-protein kinase catalytic domain-containing protein n=1 Tax=Coffea canephora TaxID=49390 RepID=A0A068VDZ1_COFCA|nr:unnamed protein product [Coffea canephora]